MAPGEPLLSPADGAEASPGPRPHWRHLAATCYVPSALCFFNYSLGLLGFPLLYESWGIPVATVAYLKTVAEVAETAFSLPASAAAIRYGAKGSLLLGSLGYVLASLCLAVAPGFWALAACYFLQSGAVKVFNRGRSILLKDVPKAFYGRTNGVLTLLRCVFMSAAPLALSWTLNSFSGVQRIFLLQAGLGLLMLASILTDCEASPSKDAKVASSPCGGGQPDKEREHIAYCDMLSGECLTVLARTVGLCSCIGMLIGAYSILLPVAALALGVPVSCVALSMTICHGTAGALSMLGGKAVDTFGRRATMTSAMLLFALGLAVLSLLETAGADRAAPLLAAAAVLLGLGDSLASPLRGALKNDNADCVRRWASERSRDEKAAIAKSFGLLDVLLDLVGVVYPIGLGLCATHLSAAFASRVFAVVGILGALWAYSLAL